jgi:hypothetical protein
VDLAKFPAARSELCFDKMPDDERLDVLADWAEASSAWAGIPPTRQPLANAKGKQS